MKFTSITLFFSLFFFQNLFAQDSIKVNSLDWVVSYKDALKKSKNEKKPILIYFKGSDWCAPCKVVDAELFESERFKELSDKSLILLEVDIPRQIDLLPVEKMIENYTLQSKFKVKAFPTILIIDYKGKLLAEKKGYILPEYYFLFLEDVIRNYN